MNKRLLIGVDVGTGSARAGVFDSESNLLSHKSCDIRMWKGDGGIFEQSSDDIWKAVCSAVNDARKAIGAEKKQICGIAFDAACSLVVVDKTGSPVTVSASGDDARNVIVWMDQRAAQQARTINTTGHPVLSYVGGSISPEMQVPKLAWLKANLPSSYARAASFFDLSDFLSWKATGSKQRSLCTLTCKWTFLGHEQRFDPSFFWQVGLGELADQEFERIGKTTVKPGEAIRQGLNAIAADELSLLPGTPVGGSLIDAHAGGVGSLSGDPGELAYILGTSACIMASTGSALNVKGVWGPYWSAMMPDQWLLEGGQSTAGSAIEHSVKMHPAYQSLCEKAAAAGKTPLTMLEHDIVATGDTTVSLARSVADLHIVPDFLGNRSPFADPSASAMLSGLKLDESYQSLQKTYVAAIMAVAYGARQTIDVLKDAGVSLHSVVMSGGISRSDLVCQIFADALQMPVRRSACAEPVLLGSALCASVAAGIYPNLSNAMKSINERGQSFEPAVFSHPNLHTFKYNAFKQLQNLNRTIGTYNQRLAAEAAAIDRRGTLS